MYKFIVGMFFLGIAYHGSSQITIEIPSDPVPKEIGWDRSETEIKSFDDMGIVSNVSTPTLTIYKPDPSIQNGTALIIAPGGGFHFLSIDNEGRKVAEWCAKNGITAFLLKYRLVPTGDNPVMEFIQKLNDQDKMDQEMKPYIEMAIADGLNAIKHVRKYAQRYNLDRNKIGIMGFSAGGTVAGSAAFHHNVDNRPDFVAPIYPALHVVPTETMPDNPMPLFIAVSSDDVFKFQDQSISLFSKWNNAGIPVEMHIYERGEHGFGMKKQNTTSDGWIDHFKSWLKMHGWLNE